MHVTTTPMLISRLYKNRSLEDKKRFFHSMEMNNSWKTRTLRKRFQLSPYFHDKLSKVYNERRSRISKLPFSANGNNSENKQLAAFENPVNMISSTGLLGRIAKLLSMLFSEKRRTFKKQWMTLMTNMDKTWIVISILYRSFFNFVTIFFWVSYWNNQTITLFWKTLYVSACIFLPIKHALLIEGSSYINFLLMCWIDFIND